MSDLIHRSYPRLLTTGTLCILSFFLLGLTIVIGFQTSNSEVTKLSLSYLILIVTITTILFYYLFKTKVILVTESQLIISNLFFPKKICFDLSEIRTLKQSKTTTTHYFGFSDSLFPSKRDRYKLNWYKTSIVLIDNKQIIINNIGEMEFELLYKVFSKRKRGEGKVKKVKGRLATYLIDNLGGLFFNLILIFLLGGLFISLIEKMN